MIAELLAFLSDLIQPTLVTSLFGAIGALMIGGGALSFGLLAIPRTVAPVTLRALAGFPLCFILGGSAVLLFFLLGVPSVAVGVILLALAGSAIALAINSGDLRMLFTRRSLLTLVALLLSSHALMFFGWGESGDGTIRASSGAWGDGALHTLNAQAVLRRAGPPATLPPRRNFIDGSGWRVRAGDISMPAYAGELIREPLGYDFVAGLLRSIGWSLGGAFSLPAAGLLAALIAWTGYLAHLFVPQRESAGWRRFLPYIFAALLICFGSGLQWIVMAQKTGSWNPAKFFGVHESVWDKQEDQGLIWANHLNSFASQKHFLLAAAFLAVLAVCLWWLLDHPKAGKKVVRRLLILCTIVTGLLPLFHAHAFIAAMLLWGAAWILSRKQEFLFGGGGAVLFAIPTLLWYLGAVTRKGFTTFSPGYLAPPGPMGWIAFWVINLGFFLPLILLSFTKKDDRNGRWLLGIPAIGLFVIGNLIQFQPYRWDNHKVFLFALLLALPLVIEELMHWTDSHARDRRWSAPVRWGIVVLVLLSLTLTTFSEVATYLQFRASFPVYTSEARAAGVALDAALPGDVILIGVMDTVHNHPATLTGRILFMGYAGWIWTRGLSHTDRTATIVALGKAQSLPDVCALARETSATHLTLGPEERTVWGSDAVDRLTTLLGSSVHPLVGGYSLGDLLHACGARYLLTHGNVHAQKEDARTTVHAGSFPVSEELRDEALTGSRTSPILLSSLSYLPVSTCRSFSQWRGKAPGWQKSMPGRNSCCPSPVSRFLSMRSSVFPL